MMARFAVGAALMAALGCGDDGGGDGGSGGADVTQFIPDAGGGADGDATDADVRLAYTDADEPRVDLPADTTGLTPPLAVVGEDTGKAGLIYAASLSGYFLLRVQQDDGSFKYEYKPDTDEWLWQDVIHRQVGPAYALVLAYGATRREEFRVGASWAFEYAAKRLEDKGDGALRLTDIGATSIFIFGLSHYHAFTTDPAWDATLIGLGKHLLALQKADGSFTEGSALARGQAVQALAHLDEFVGGESYRTALLAAAGYTCDHPSDIKLNDLPYFLLYANEAYRYLAGVTGDQRWVTCSDDYTQPVIDDQYVDAPGVDPAWVGGFGRTGGGTPNWSTSLRTEPIVDALALALALGDTARADMLREHVRIGSDFALRQQWRRGETDDYPNPPEIIGDYPYYLPGQTGGSLGWPLSRTDLAWHGTAMMVKAARALGAEDFPGK